MRGLGAVVLAAVLAAATLTSGTALAQEDGGDPIKLGFVYPDLDVAKQLGFAADVGDPEAQFMAFVDDLNERGGIDGRTVEPSVYKYDVLSDIDVAQRAACLEATEDDEVFALVTISFFGDPILCVTRQHNTPLISSGGAPAAIVAQSKRNLYLTNFVTEQAITNEVPVLAKAGALKGKTIGVLTGDGPGEEANVAALERALKRAGAELAEQVVLPGVGLADTEAAIPPAVERLNATGVDALFATTNVFVTSTFMKAALAADYSPTYLMTDVTEGSSDFLASRAPEGALDKARGVTWRLTGSEQTGEAPPAFGESCNEIFTAATGTSYEVDDGRWAAVTGVCGLVNVFEQAATAAGPELTTAAFRKALQGLKDVEIGFGQPGSFGPKKFGAPDTVRLLEYDAQCKCWTPDGRFQPVSR